MAPPSFRLRSVPNKPVELTLYEIMMISAFGMTNRNSYEDHRTDCGLNAPQFEMRDVLQGH